MVSLGGFSYDVTVNTSQGIQSLQNLQVQAIATYAALRGGTSGAQITLNTQQATAALSALTQAGAAAATKIQQPITPQINTKPAQTSLQQLGQSVASGLGFGSGAAVAITAIHGIEDAIKGAVQTGVEYNASLETTINTLEHYTGSTEKAQQALAEFRKIATESPFKEQQVIGTGQSFIRTTGGDIQRAEELTRLTVALGAAHPELPFDRIRASVLQLISGDYRAFEDSTNSAFGSVAKLAATGVSGIDLYRKAIEQAGGSTDLLAKNATTFTARLTTLQSAADKLIGSLTRGGFEEASADIGKANDAVKEHGDNWNRAAEAIGRATAQAAKFLAENSQGGRALGGFAESVGQVGDFIGSRLPRFPEQQATVQAQSEKVAQADALDKITGQTNTQTNALKENEAEAKKITNEYEASVHPLQAQLTVIQQLYQADDARLQKAQALNAVDIAHLSQRSELAQAPPEIRADVAGSEAAIAIQQRQLDITNKRADLARQTGDAEIAVANDVAQAQTRGAERSLQAQQRSVQAAQQARQIEIQNIQEVQRANQEARADEIRGIQESIQSRRQGYQDERDAIRETQRAAEERWQDESRAADRTQERIQQGYQAQIARLQEINRVANLAANAPSAAERQLTALDAAERRYQAARSLSQAKDAVKNANTPAERKSAEANLSELKHEQEIERKRLALEATIKAQKEAEDAARLAREERIRQLQLKAQQEAAQYQKEKEARDDAHAAALEQQAADNRKADKEEHDKERTEDLQIKAAEKTDRDLARSEAATLRETQQADRTQSAKEAAGILAAQVSIEAQNNKLADEAAKRQLAADKDHLDRLNESAPLEAARLANLQTILDNENKEEEIRLARESSLAESTKTHLDNVQKIRDAEKEVAGIDTVARLTELKTAEELRLVPVLANKDAVLATLDALEKTKELLTSGGPIEKPLGPQIPVIGEGPQIPLEKPPEAKKAAATPNQDAAKGFDLFGIHLPTADEIKAIGQGIIDGLANGLTAGTDALAKATTDWLHNGAIQTAISLLEIGSPSKLFGRMGGDTAQGFADGYATIDLATPIGKPFTDATAENGPLLTFEAAMTTAGDTSAHNFETAYELVGLSLVIQSPFNDFLDKRTAYFYSGFTTFGQTSAEKIGTGFESAKVGNAMYTDLVGALRGPLAGLYPSFVQLGYNYGQSMANGFSQAVADWHALEAGGASAGQQIGHAAGGGNIHGLTLVGEGGPEILNTTGQVLPADTTANILAAASGHAPGAGSGSSPTNVTNNFNISQHPGESMDALADRIVAKSVESTIYHLDQAHRNQSERLSREQSGAD